MANRFECARNAFTLDQCDGADEMAIYDALTLATESEQLRKERDELAAFIRQKHDVLEVPTEIFNLCIQNR